MTPYSAFGGGAGGKWIVRFPGFYDTFPNFLAAKTWLLNEIQWLAEDLDHEQSWAAWDRVRHWDPRPDTLGFCVSAGDPPGEYEIIRYGYEIDWDESRI